MIVGITTVAVQHVNQATGSFQIDDGWKFKIIAQQKGHIFTTACAGHILR